MWAEFYGIANLTTVFYEYYARFKHSLVHSTCEWRISIWDPSFSIERLGVWRRANILQSVTQVERVAPFYDRDDTKLNDSLVICNATFSFSCYRSLSGCQSQVPIVRIYYECRIKIAWCFDLIHIFMQLFSLEKSLKQLYDNSHNIMMIWKCWLLQIFNFRSLNLILIEINEVQTPVYAKYIGKIYWKNRNAHISNEKYVIV